MTKSWVRRMSVLAASLTVAGSAVTISATAEVLAYECSAGYSCYYDGNFGTNRIFIAPSEGCHTLASNVVNRISSVRNRGFGTAHLYDGNSCSGELLISVIEGRQVTLGGVDDNRTNSIRVDH
jgi:hypothetical protein